MALNGVANLLTDSVKSGITNAQEMGRQQSAQDAALAQLIKGKQMDAASSTSLQTLKGGQDIDQINAKATADQGTHSANTAYDLSKVPELQSMAPDGSGIRVGDLSTTKDPYAAMLGKNQAGSAKAVQDVNKQYMAGLQKIQPGADAAAEGLEAINDPKNSGSLGQARTLMLKSMGMNRYNEQEAKAVLPSALQGVVSGLFNSVGDDQNPLNGSQKAAIGQFFQHQLDTSKNNHEMLKANVMNGYNMSQYADPARAQSMSATLGKPFSDRLTTYADRYKAVPATGGYNPQAPAPEPGMIDKLTSFLRGPQQTAAPAASAPAMSFDEFKKARAAGKL